MDQPQTSRWAMQFHGQGGEYFRIWIVNLLLTVLTLGIYSAWAKVRRLKYIYGNTELAGSRFDYVAKPLTILKGRIIAFALFAAYAVAGQLHPAAGVILVLVFAAVMPWIVVRSIKFNAWYTRYRNVPFGFDGTVAQGYKYFLLVPLLVIPSLGLALPYIVHQQHRFIVGNLRFGRTPFAVTESAVGKFYIAYLIMMAATTSVTMVVALLVGVGAGIGAAAGVSLSDGLAAGMIVVGVLAYALMLVGFAVAGQTLRVMQHNLIWSRTELSDARFTSNVNPWAFARMMAWRLPLTVLTLGLAAPWLKMASTRMRIEGMSIEAPNEFSSFESAVEQYGGAVGSEVSDLFDVDIAF
ncbi:YjgN family protein [Chitinibacteraceae bacterium HSL-7]